MVKSAPPADGRPMKKNDLILIAALLAVALLAYAGVSLYSKVSTNKAEAVVYQQGKEQGRYRLSENTVVEISLENGDYNILQIREGQAEITEASCPDKTCVRHRPISRQGESLVCLPNQLVVEIENGADSGIDGATD